MLFDLDRYIEFYAYPWSIIRYGLVAGTGLMMLVSFALCWALIALYDWVSGTGQVLPDWLPAPVARTIRTVLPHLQDALGFETIKEVALKTQDSILDPQPPAFRIGGYLGWVLTALYPVRYFWYLTQAHVVRPVWMRFPKARRTILFLHLSVLTDPMTTTVLMRPVNHFSMGKEEWKLFLLSVLVSCSSWALLVWLGIESISELWPIVREAVVSAFDWLAALPWEEVFNALVQ
jgi:hypothetical protein